MAVEAIEAVDVLKAVFNIVKAIALEEMVARRALNTLRVIEGLAALVGNKREKGDDWDEVGD